MRLTIDDVDWIIPHQANSGSSRHQRSLGAPLEKYIVNIEKYGNTSAASVIVALDEAARQALQEARYHFVDAFVAGYVGATVLEWCKDEYASDPIRAGCAGGRHGRDLAEHFPECRALFDRAGKCWGSIWPRPVLRVQLSN
jgi:hypothetical protein